MLSELGYRNVKTYIQSGNAIFDADDTPNIVRESIQAAFQSTFKFGSEIVLRTKDEIHSTINMFPFSEEEIKAAVASNFEVEHLYFYFADSMLSDSVIHTLNASYGKPDKLSAGPGGDYLLCYKSVRDSTAIGRLYYLKYACPKTARFSFET